MRFASNATRTRIGALLITASSAIQTVAAAEDVPLQPQLDGTYAVQFSSQTGSCPEFADEVFSWRTIEAPNEAEIFENGQPVNVVPGSLFFREFFDVPTRTQRADIRLVVLVDLDGTQLRLSTQRELRYSGAGGVSAWYGSYHVVASIEATGAVYCSADAKLYARRTGAPQ